MSEVLEMSYGSDFSLSDGDSSKKEVEEMYAIVLKL